MFIASNSASSLHSFYQFDAVSRYPVDHFLDSVERNRIPGGEQRGVQLCDGVELLSVLLDVHGHDQPQMFDWIEVR